jgi:carboxyl-terminal processing protease
MQRTFALTLAFTCGILPRLARAADPPKFPDGEKAFAEARATLLREFVDPKMDENELYRAALAGMLSQNGKRPWDALLSPDDLAEMHEELTGQIVGIGIEVKFDSDSGQVSVLGLISGSPAEKAGVLAGDRVLKIDGKSLKGLQLRDVVHLIRGPAGQSVTLTLLREDQIVSRTVKRAAIAWSPVHELTLPGPIALVSVMTFNEKTPSLLKAALEHARASKPRGLVLDLRGNQGGLFDKLVDCASLMLPKGKLVVTRIGRGGAEEAYRSTGDPLLDVPVLVLADGSTASSAELFAGALQQSGGARVIGKRTHGKWNVQKVVELKNGWALKYTIGVFKSPRGELLDGKGLEPDLEVEMPGKEDAVEKVQRIKDPKERLANDPQLRAAVALLKL